MSRMHKGKGNPKGKLSGTQKEQQEIATVTAKYPTFEPVLDSVFTDFPLSEKTLKGLEECGFQKPTEIQIEAVPLALKQTDLLAAAKTGSGKTLAFLIPTVECLWRNRWSFMDGLGALILSPTRELALQSYEVLRKVGKYHDFSAALIIGGTDMNAEKNRLAHTNIIIATPGRLLQHMDENPQFNCDHLQMLVLDEADRILDLGFKNQINAILEFVPTERQTMMFSATQTTSVKDLARLSLKDPVYVSVHEHSSQTTPEQLEQSYMVLEEEDKLNFLWSFMKYHRRKKTLVFFSTCKQVRYIHECFKRLRPPISILCLHGSMSQSKRVAAYEEFCSKSSAVLIATDVAARGLDFPSVHWVLQLDCPADVNEYIHRVGRTARYDAKGESLLIVTPNQKEPMVAELTKRRIPISEINMNTRKLNSVQNKLEIICAADPELKIFAQRSFVAYLRSVSMMQNKKVFSVKHIDLEKFSRSLGLVITPRVRFLKQNQTKKEGDANLEFKVEDDTEDDMFTMKKIESLDHLPASSGKISKRKQQRLKQEIKSETETPLVFEETKMETGGGLNIEEAKLALAEADIIDKKAFTDRVKRQHQENKRKQKERDALRKNRRLKEPQTVMLKGEDSGDENDHSVDLSWLPDPDKLYGPDKSEGNSRTSQKKGAKRKKVSHPPLETQEILAMKLLETV